jgi:hypothetical protein
MAKHFRGDLTPLVGQKDFRADWIAPGPAYRHKPQAGLSALPLSPMQRMLLLSGLPSSQARGLSANKRLWIILLSA